MTGATVGSASASYAYDAFDVRVSGTVSGTSSSYLWDRLAPYPTLVDDGVYGYLHGAGPQAQIDGSGNRHYLLSDALASIRGVTDGSGALVGSTTYDAFGALRSQTGTGSAFGYTGELYTAATGLLHLRARDLNPTLGRFLSADTVQPNAPSTQGFNLYAYVANNPTLWVDPSGHGLDGYWGTLMFLPVMAAAFALASSLSTQIAITIAAGKNPDSWRFGNNISMTQMGLATLALVLRCALLPNCMGAMRSMRGAAGQLGSDSSEGKRAWSLPDIAELPLGWPRLPDWELPWPGGSNPAANNPSLTPLELPMDGSLGRPNPLGPIGTACLLNGLAGLTMDAYGYIGTAGQNANIAFNVMYNMMSCGAAGGSGSYSNDGPSSGSGPRINPTQENWPGTNLPRSFEIIASDGSRYWVHPNATEHMFELLRRTPAGNTEFSEQLLLESFDQAIVTARQQGFQYDYMYHVGNWELKFGAPRESGMLPVVFHALFKP